MTEAPIQPDCTCPDRWEHLVTVIEGQRLPARRSETIGPTTALFRAYCAACGAEYPGPWRLVGLR